MPSNSNQYTNNTMQDALFFLNDLFEKVDDEIKNFFRIKVRSTLN